MNSNYGRSNISGFDFDLGLSSNNSKSLNDRKNNTTTPSHSSSSTFPRPNTTPSWQPNKPSWTHQPAAPSQPVRPGSLNGPTSMVGDITGKSWGSSASANNIGIVDKNPNLFGDLVGPALGQNKSNSSVPLKNITPVANKSAYSMGAMADSLLKTGNSVKSSGNWGTSGAYNNSTSHVNVSNSKSPNLGGPSMGSSVGSGLGGGLKTNKDPFGSLVGFGSNPAGTKSGSKGNAKKTNLGDDGFGDFQNATKSSASAFSSSAFPVNNNSVGSSGGSYSKMDDFVFATTQNQLPIQSSGVNDFDMLFSSSSTSAGGGATKGSESLGSQQFSGTDDWDTEFGGGNDMGGMTELEGLPPPPSGVTASSAKNKGMENYKQGQYPDAIKWLSWAVVLFGKISDNDGTNEVLSSRASCYKEVGEYKKAVADCTKVLEHDDKNVSILVQRALLYESMEKYKLGAEDLGTVMKLDPGNRVARSTIHRLRKMAEQ